MLFSEPTRHLTDDVLKIVLEEKGVRHRKLIADESAVVSRRSHISQSRVAPLPAGNCQHGDSR